MSRKDSKGMPANVLVGLGQEAASVAPLATSASPHLLKVAAGVRQLQERGELADKLLQGADHIIELDVDAVLPSHIRDRFDGAYDADRLQDLLQSMREHGQTTPGMVRPFGGEGASFRSSSVDAVLLPQSFSASSSEQSSVIFRTNRRSSSRAKRMPIAMTFPSLKNAFSLLVRRKQGLNAK